MTANPNDNSREISAEGMRQALVERIRTDRAFAELLIADPAQALEGNDPAALFGSHGDEGGEVQGFQIDPTANLGWSRFCWSR